MKRNKDKLREEWGRAKRGLPGKSTITNSSGIQNLWFWLSWRQKETLCSTHSANSFQIEGLVVWFGWFPFLAEHYGGEPPITHHKKTNPTNPLSPFHQSSSQRMIDWSGRETYRGALGPLGRRFIHSISLTPRESNKFHSISFVFFSRLSFHFIHFTHKSMAWASLLSWLVAVRLAAAHNQPKKKPNHALSLTHTAKSNPILRWLSMPSREEWIAFVFAKKREIGLLIDFAN